MRPALVDKIGVPAQHRPWGDDQAQLPEAAPGQQPGQRGQDRPVGPGQLRRLDLALQDGNLVTQEEDLGIFSPIAGGRTTEGLYTRIAQRLLALAACVWHNWATGAPVRRSLIEYDH